jgi:hypothetical protein
MTVGSLTASAEEPSSTRFAWVDALKLAHIGLQLGLAILVIQSFRLESPTFQRLMLITGAGFLVHAVLPQRMRQTWFILLSLAAIGVIFGLAGGVWLIGVGVLLIGIARLPINWWARVTLLLATGALLGVMRTGLLPAPFSPVIWPILASMFMFRLIVYMHHLRHHPKGASLPRTLAYFFMLPNVAFPLFPVVDYKTFDTTYYDSDRWAIYQTGVRWIARGLFHLVLYRFVYYYMASDPAELVTLGDLLKYVTATYLIYLRVSGQFHIIIGILHLFGWNLPEGNHLYFLSSGFTDFWRRINIYWKDFMMKLVFNPSYFRMRPKGNTRALVIATLIVFLVTWLLHSYQWFWTRGSFPLTATDMLFWGTLGVCMVVQMVREANKPRQRAAKPAWSLKRGLSTVAFFCAMSALWALWDSQSIGEYLSIWSVATNASGSTLLLAGGLLAAGVAVAGWPWGVQPVGLSRQPQPFWRRSDVQTVAACLGMLAIAQPRVTGLVGTPVTTFAQSLRETKLNERDAASMHRGYYEQINTATGGLGGGELEEINDGRPADWVPLTETAVYRSLTSFLGGELVPGTRLEFKGEPLTINSVGMRDREYSRTRPDSAVRIALLGPSDIMGAGVADSQTFETRLEARLNRDLSPTTGKGYEILNFGVVSFSMLQQMEMLEQRALEYQPNVIVVAFHPISEARFAFQFLANQVRFGQEVPYADLRDMAEKAGVRKGMRQPDAFRRLKPHGEELLRWTLNRIDSLATARGAKVVLLVRDMPAEQSEPSNPVIEFARSAGMTVMDIRGVFTGVNVDSLKVAAWDKHPNARGHQMIADRLFTEFAQHDSLIH